MLQGNKLQGILFTYDASYKTNKDRVRFHRELYGSIHYGKNKIEKKGGILSEISFINPTRSCIIVKKKDANYLRDFFKRHKVKWSEHLVILNEREANELL